jgi:HK97 gp10 family phage protein
MSDDFSIDIRGLAETQRAIYDFSEKLGDRVTLLALRAGANFMLKKVRAAEPVKTGRLKRATVVKTSRINQRRRNGKVGVYLTIKKGKKKDDPKGAYYGYFVEHGYKKAAANIAGKQFVSNTFNANKNEALTIIVTALERGGEQLIQQIGRR